MFDHVSASGLCAQSTKVLLDIGLTARKQSIMSEMEK